MTDNETDTISVGQGKVLFGRCAAPVSASPAALTNLVKHAAGSEAADDGKLICGCLRCAGGGHNPADQSEDFQ